MSVQDPTFSAGTHRAAKTRPKKGSPRPRTVRNLHAGRRGRGEGRAYPPCADRGWRKRENPTKRQRAIPAHSMPGREGGTP